MVDPPVDPIARAAALAALGHRERLDDDDVVRLEDACDGDPDARVRAGALAALVRAGPAAPTRRAWTNATTDRDPAVRRRAAELAPAAPRPVAVAPLVELLHDEDVTVVEAASWALGELGDVAIAGAAVAALVLVVETHADPLAREAAVAALGALGDPAGLPAILTACADRPAVRRRAVLALSPFTGTEVDAAIERALTDKDWQVRQAAEDLR
ncbi:MAG TPA: HEAT repeat domain-containing protein [Acidimicrobiia bacterium]